MIHRNCEVNLIILQVIKLSRRKLPLSLEKSPLKRNLWRYVYLRWWMFLRSGYLNQFTTIFLIYYVVLRRMQLLINMQPFVEYRSTLKKGELAFSYDLSSATDRLPIQLQIHLLSWIYPGLGENWAALLINRSYQVPSRANLKKQNVFYKCGQPMGAILSNVGSNSSFLFAICSIC